MSKNPPEGVSVGLGEDENIFQWEILLVGPPDTLYEGGFFKATLDFPSNFPNMPPKMTFRSEMWHPNGLFHRPIFLLNTRFTLFCVLDSSVPQWYCVYFDFTSTRRRSDECTRDRR